MLLGPPPFPLPYPVIPVQVEPGLQALQSDAARVLGKLQALDLEGHRWSFSQTVRTVTRAEAEAAIGQPIVATEWA